MSRWWRAALICAAGLWIYWPALAGGWIWDDAAEVRDNVELREMGGLTRIWTQPVGPDYLPLKSSVQWVEWRLWGGHPLGYHLVNLGLHLLAACLIWRILRRLGVPAAWLGGLAFAVHPLAVESVAWIAELKNVLSLCLVLASLDAWLDFDVSRRPADYSRALLWFFAALLAKTSVVMFPAFLLVYGWWRKKRRLRQNWFAVLPFFAVSVALGAVTVWFQHHRAMEGVLVEVGAPPSPATVAAADLGFYAGKFLWPRPLLPIYPRWSSGAAVWGWAAGGAVLMALVVGCGARRERWAGALLLGGGWYLLNLLPVLNLVPMAYARISWVADHLAYLSLAALAGLSAAAYSAMAAHRARRPFAIAAAVIILGFWGLESRGYARIYSSESAFWDHAAEHNPAAWVARNNRGMLYLEKGEAAEAITEFRAALAAQPADAEAHFNLGLALAARGDAAAALQEDAEAVRLRPNAFAPAWVKLGAALAAGGKEREAMQDFAAALRIDPANPDANFGVASALRQGGQAADSIVYYERVISARPEFVPAHDGLGIALAQGGRWAEAEAQFSEALRLDPADAAARRDLEQARQLAAAPAR